MITLGWLPNEVRDGARLPHASAEGACRPMQPEIRLRIKVLVWLARHQRGPDPRRLPFFKGFEDGKGTQVVCQLPWIRSKFTLLNEFAGRTNTGPRLKKG